MLRVCDKNADEVRLYWHAKELLEMGVHEGGEGHSLINRTPQTKPL